jgi:hypothetical protein
METLSWADYRIPLRIVTKTEKPHRQAREGREGRGGREQPHRQGRQARQGRKKLYREENNNKDQIKT